MTREDESLLTCILNLETERDLEGFLRGLMGDATLESIFTKWRVLNKLKQSLPQRRIAQEEGIALAKVNQIAKILHQDDNFLKQLLDKRYDETEL